jgi:hypothetical protein
LPGVLVYGGQYKECVYLRMSLLVVAFPVIDAKDLEWVQSWRKENDGLFYKIVDPHFTIVFAIDDKTEEEFIKEIEAGARGFSKIEFEIKKAILHKDEFSEYYHEFLIPEKGYEEMLALHDKINAGALVPHWRKDIEYIPHIGIGNSKDKLKSEKDIVDLNASSLSIRGEIDCLTIVEYSNDTVIKIKELQLA